MATTPSATMKNAWRWRWAAAWLKTPSSWQAPDARRPAQVFSVGRDCQPGRADYLVPAVGNAGGAPASGRFMGGAESRAAADPPVWRDQARRLHPAMVIDGDPAVFHGRRGARL